MNWVSLLLLPIALIACTLPSHAHGKADHVVVVVWDGMRPDFVRPQYTPVLHELARRGTFFLHHHSAYITSTEVNGTALATGMHPDHSGIMANTGYRPDLSWLNPYGTESLDAVRRGDFMTGGHYLESMTVAEILQQAGFPTIIAGAKPIALLHDRAPKKTNQAQKDSITLFRGQSLPRAALENLTRAPDIGPVPPVFLALGPLPVAAEVAATNSPVTAGRRPRELESPNTPDNWTTKALVRGLWRKGVPKYTLLWLSEPDAAQHEHSPGSPGAVAALASSDRNLGLVLKALDDKGVLDHTDVFVVSDHGFSTVNRGPDIIDSLNRAHFTAGKQFQNPESGDIMVINLGGSISFYVFDHDEAVISRLVTFLQSTDFAGVLFSALPLEGTFPLSLAHVATTNAAPDVLMSMRWSPEENEYGAPGMIASVESKAGRGTHASLSRFDLRNTLIAAGPDFKRGFVNPMPSGNIDLAPTVLSILGIDPPFPMDGRVLFEAMVGSVPAPPRAKEEKLEARREFGFLSWTQYLETIQIGSATYYEEGNGSSRLR